VSIDDAKFDALLTAALYRASEIDYADMPSDEELEIIIQPSLGFQRKLNALLRAPKRYIRKQRKPVYLRALQYAASVVLALAVLLGVSMVVSPTVRASVINFVRSWLEDRTEYWTPEQELNYEWSPRYIPDGFELIMQHNYEAGTLRLYQNGDATMIHIVISRGKQIFDNEHSVLYQTEINGHAVDVYESNNPQYQNIVVIHDAAAGIIISIMSVIELNELLKIAENMG